MIKRKEFLIWTLALFGGLIAVYLNHFNNAFHFDDSHTIVTNFHIRNLANIPRFFTDANSFSSLPTNVSYRPLLSASFAFDYYWGKGLNPFSFQMTSFLLFLGQIGLMLFFYKKFFNGQKDRNWIFTLLAVSVYGFHTSLAETVNYIVARGDIISALASIASFVLYLYFPRQRKYCFYLLPGLLGILAKPVTAVFFPLIVVYALIFENKNRKQLLLEFFSSSLFVLSVLMIVRHFDPVALSYSEGYPLDYRLTQPYVSFLYFKTFFLPIHLSADTDLSVITNLRDYRLWGGILFVLGMLGLAWGCLKKEKLKAISFGIFWFFITLLPTSLIPLNETMNDHRLYFPYVGLALSIGAALALLFEKMDNWKFEKTGKFFLQFFLIFFISLNAYGVYKRNQVWKTEKSLWYDVTQKSPENGRGLTNYSNILIDEGKYEEAKEYIEQALQYVPNYPYLYMAIARLKEIENKFEDSEIAYKKAMSIGLYTPVVGREYGQWLIRRERYFEAIQILEENLVKAPEDIQLRYGLLYAYYKIAHLKKLNLLVQELLKKFPEDETFLGYKRLIDHFKSFKTSGDYVGLGQYYLRGGEPLLAIRANEKALDLDLSNVRAYSSLCSLHLSMKSYREAAFFCKEGLKRNPQDQILRMNAYRAKKLLN